MLRHTLLGLSLVALACLNSNAADWSRFRGPNGSGVSAAPVPVEFGAEKNMAWKIKLPGRGVSSPIIVGDKVFVTCWSGYGGDLGRELENLKRHLVCVDRKTGKKLWDKTVSADLPEDPWSGMGVPAHGYASHTPASDGERVFCFFGKGGVVAFDFDGKQLWKVSVGKESGPRRWGSAASPIVHKDTVIVNASDESEAMVGLDAATGKEKWRAAAGGLASTWGTPAMVNSSARGDEIVLAVPGEVWGFNPESGKLRWYAPGNEGASHSVVVDGDVIYSIGGGRGGSNGIAVRAGGKGEIADDNIVWENRAGGRFATPLVYSGHLYTLNGSIVACYGTADGKKIFEKRLPESAGSRGNAQGGNRERGGRSGGPGGGGGSRGFGGRGGSDYASPIVAGERIYITRNSGSVHVLATGSEYKLLATNDLSFDSSGFAATPAAADGQLIIRSHTHLYCFSE